MTEHEHDDDVVARGRSLTGDSATGSPRRPQPDGSPRCTNDSPPWFTGRWRDWHRGHGCDKDDGQPRTIEGAREIQAWERRPAGAARQLLDLERDLRESLRGGYLFGNFDEPLDAASMRVVRVIQQRLSDLPCDCTDRTPDVGGHRCKACGGRLP